MSGAGRKGYWGQNPENRAGWAQFLLMHGGAGNFCVGDVWLRWGKVGLGRCVAAIEWHRQEGVPGKMQWLCKCVGCGSAVIDPPPPPILVIATKWFWLAAN